MRITELLTKEGIMLGATCMSKEDALAQAVGLMICGELGGDLELTRTFLKMGVDELSVSPGKVLSLREIIRKTDLSKLS